MRCKQEQRRQKTNESLHEDRVKAAHALSDAPRTHTFQATTSQREAEEAGPEWHAAQTQSEIQQLLPLIGEDEPARREHSLMSSESRPENQFNRLLKKRFKHAVIYENVQNNYFLVDEQGNVRQQDPVKFQ